MTPVEAISTRGRHATSNDPRLAIPTVFPVTILTTGTAARWARGQWFSEREIPQERPCSCAERTQPWPPRSVVGIATAGAPRNRIQKWKNEPPDEMTHVTWASGWSRGGIAPYERSARDRHHREHLARPSTGVCTSLGRGPLVGGMQAPRIEWSGCPVTQTVRISLPARCVRSRRRRRGPDPCSARAGTREAR